MITETTYRFVWKLPNMRKWRVCNEYTVTTWPDGRTYADITWYNIRTGKYRTSYMTDADSIPSAIARWLGDTETGTPAVRYTHYEVGPA